MSAKTQSIFRKLRPSLAKSFLLDLTNRLPARGWSTGNKYPVSAGVFRVPVDERIQESSKRLHNHGPAALLELTAEPECSTETFLSALSLLTTPPFPPGKQIRPTQYGEEKTFTLLARLGLLLF